MGGGIGCMCVCRCLALIIMQRFFAGQQGRGETLGGFDISAQGEERQTSKRSGSLHRKQ